MEKFSERLKELRHLNGLSQQDVANSVGITRSAYANYEQGTREPDLFTLKKLCLLFEISADFLLNINLK